MREQALAADGRRLSPAHQRRAGMLSPDRENVLRLPLEQGVSTKSGKVEPIDIKLLYYSLKISFYWLRISIR